MHFSKRKSVICTISFLVCLSLLITQSFALSLEEVISRRQSIRDYTSTTISRQQLLDILWTAYGYKGEQRNVPQIGSAYSLVLYTLNETGSYRYIPENNSLIVHDLTVDKTTGAILEDWAKNASDIIVIVWNETAMSNSYFATAEAGCVAQNVYLKAASMDLGACVVGYINSGGLRTDLGLASTLTPLYVMPLGIPTSAYPSATPKYSIMNGNLPQVQNSTLTFEDSINNIAFTQEWSDEPLSLQMLSQLLWASYGYSSTDHVTVPSAYGTYPLIVYVSNATGIYQYSPDTHSVTEIVSGDERYDIANALSGQTWAADAPATFIIAYDSSAGGDGGFFDHMFVETDAGCVVQQLFLEAAAWNLEAGIVSDASEVWDGSDAQAVRGIMGVSSSIIPLYAIAVGVPEGVDSTPPIVGVPSQDPLGDSVEADQSVTVTVDVTDEGVGVDEVVLSYSSDDGDTWIGVTMSSVSGDTYSGEIPGFGQGEHIQYRILAYDNNINLAVEDNSGSYYTYTVIIEIQDFLIVVSVVSAALAIILMLMRKEHKEK